MAIGFANALPPGLMGYAAADQMRLQENAQQLQQLVGVTNVRGALADQAEKERVRGLMGQFSNVMAGGDERQLLGLLGQINPQAAMTYLLQKADTQYGSPVQVETPQGPRFAMPDRRGGMKITEHVPHRPERAVGTSQERDFKILTDLQQKIDAGTQITQAEDWAAQAARARLSQARWAVDPSSGQLYQTQAMTIPQGITVGTGGGARPGAPAAAPGAAPGDGVPGGQPPLSDPRAPTSAPPPPPSSKQAEYFPAAVNRLPSMEGGRRSVTAKTKDDLGMLGKAHAQIVEQIRDFDDRYAGFISETAGRVVEESDARLKDSPLKGQMAKWWRGERQRRADLRRAIAGMTLTGFEKTDFESYNPHSGLTPQVLRDDLTRQRAIIEREMANHLNAANRGGYNVEEVKGWLGLRSPDWSEDQKLPAPVMGAQDAGGGAPQPEFVWNPQTKKLEPVR